MPIDSFSHSRKVLSLHAKIRDTILTPPRRIIHFFNLTAGQFCGTRCCKKDTYTVLCENNTRFSCAFLIFIFCLTFGTYYLFSHCYRTFSFKRHVCRQAIVRSVVDTCVWPVWQTSDLLVFLKQWLSQIRSINVHGSATVRPICYTCGGRLIICSRTTACCCKQIPVKWSERWTERGSFGQQIVLLCRENLMKLSYSAIAFTV